MIKHGILVVLMMLTSLSAARADIVTITCPKSQWEGTRLEFTGRKVEHGQDSIQFNTLLFLIDTSNLETRVMWDGKALTAAATKGNYPGWFIVFFDENIQYSVDISDSGRVILSYVLHPTGFDVHHVFYKDCLMD